MAIIVSQNGKNAQRLDPAEFQLEDHLQEYIYNNPESIPLYEISEDIRLLVLAREFPTGSGPIDALGVDQNGQIYLVETKLYRNNDKRLVVAQVLDYGASLWRHSVDFNEFLAMLDTRVRKAFDLSLEEKLQEFFTLDPVLVEQLLANMRSNLNSGNFKFVVLMDRLHDRLRDLIVYMNSNSNFDIYAVELEYYRHRDFEIIIPKLYGGEVKKEVKTQPKGLMLTDDEIVQAYAEVGLRRQIEEFLALYNDIKNGAISITGICLAPSAKKILSLTQTGDYQTSASLYITPERVPQIDIWTVKEKEAPIAAALVKIGIEPKPMKLATGKVGKIPLETFNRETFVRFLQELGKA